MVWALRAAWLCFLAVSAWAMWEVGYFGILRSGFADPGAIQIFFDLVVACSFASRWVYRDARTRGINPWPWIAPVLLLGSLPLLTYAVLRPWLSPSERT